MLNYEDVKLVEMLNGEIRLGMGRSQVGTELGYHAHNEKEQHSIWILVHVFGRV